MTQKNMLIGLVVVAVVAIVFSFIPGGTEKSEIKTVLSDVKPAVVYDMGGKFDKSFNEGVWNGVKKFTDETGIQVMEFEVTNETQREQAIRRMAERGATIILGVGFAQADAISKVAAEFPNT
ncbi:MAG: BMP family ABC transporter substrate-binding protein, partial [Gammaproteobacteria bacterium]